MWPEGGGVTIQKMRKKSQEKLGIPVTSGRNFNPRLTHGRLKVLGTIMLKKGNGEAVVGNKGVGLTKTIGEKYISG